MYSIIHTLKYVFLPPYRNGQEVCCSGYTRNLTSGNCDSMYTILLSISECHFYNVLLEGIRSFVLYKLLTNDSKTDMKNTIAFCKLI